MWGQCCLIDIGRRDESRGTTNLDLHTAQIKALRLVLQAHDTIDKQEVQSCSQDGFGGSDGDATRFIEEPKATGPLKTILGATDHDRGHIESGKRGESVCTGTVERGERTEAR